MLHSQQKLPCFILLGMAIGFTGHHLLCNLHKLQDSNDQYKSRLHAPELGDSVFSMNKNENSSQGDVVKPFIQPHSNTETTTAFSSREFSHHVSNNDGTSSITHNIPSYTNSLVESHGFLKYSDNNWQRKKRLHDWQSKRQHGRQVSPGRVFYQENWEPTWSCDFEQRIGKIGDGGKWLCDAYLIAESKKCNVISIGSFNDWSFEEAIYELNPRCKIFTFDHTINPKKKPDYVTFYDTGLDSKTHGKLGTMDFLIEMAGLSNQVIDILKIDCEGCEWGVYKQLFTGFIRQILIELHGVGPGFKVNNFFTEMDRHGYVIFHKEPNTLGCGGDCIEYALLKLNLQPTSVSTSYQSYDAEKGGQNVEKNTDKNTKHSPFDRTKSMECYDTTHAFGNALFVGMQVVCGASQKHIDSSSQSICLNNPYWESLFSRSSAFCHDATCVVKSTPYQTPEFKKIRKILHIPAVKKCMASKFSVNKSAAKFLVTENAWQPPCAVHARFGDGVAFKHPNGTFRHKKYQEVRLCSPSLECFEKILQRVVKVCAPVTRVYLATDLHSFHEYAIHRKMLNIVSIKSDEVHIMDIPSKDLHFSNHAVRAAMADWIALFSAKRSYGFGGSTFFESAMILRSHADNPTVG